MKNFYAIKIGRNVKDLVIDNWEECKNYVLYYNSIYKGFKTKNEARKWLNSWTDEEIAYRLEKQLFYRNIHLKKKILSDLNFRLNIDILNFILENTYNYNEICKFIDINIEDNKISAYKAGVLKNYLKENILNN